MFIMDYIMLPDYHIHTALCRHATGKAIDYKATAKIRQIPEICFTDHAPSPDGYDTRHRMGIEEMPRYKSMVLDLKDGKPPDVMLGIEADYYEGCETFLKKWLPAHDFDLVLGSVHFIENWGFDNPDERQVWDSVDVTVTWRKYFHIIGKLADSGLYDAVAHIDLPKKFGHRPSDKNLKEMVGPALDRIRKADMGIEINTAGLHKYVKEIYPSPIILSMAFEREIPICFGSDSHSPDEVGRDFGLALSLARQVGYTHYFKISRRIKALTPLPQI